MQSASFYFLTTIWLFVGDVTAAVGIDPSHHVHVVGHERGNLTLENSRVAAYRELIVNLNFKVLGYHCNEARKKESLAFVLAVNVAGARFDRDRVD